MAGPFDRFCGFCGHELVLGQKRSRARRLWLLAGLVPILAGLAVGVSPIGQQAVRGVAANHPLAAARPTITDRSVGFSAAAPGWTLQDLSVSGRPVAVLFSDPSDAPAAAGSPAALVTARPKGVVVEVVRPAIADPGVDPTDPTGVLAYETAQLLAGPPPGYSLATVSPVRGETLNGRRAAVSVLSVAGAGGTPLLLEKVYISAPGGGLLLVEVLMPPSELAHVDQFVRSLQLTR